MALTAGSAIEAESAILEKLEKQYLNNDCYSYMLGKTSIAKLQGMMRETDTAGSESTSQKAASAVQSLLSTTKLIDSLATKPAAKWMYQ